MTKFIPQLLRTLCRVGVFLAGLYLFPLVSVGAPIGGGDPTFKINVSATQAWIIGVEVKQELVPPGGMPPYNPHYLFKGTVCAENYKGYNKCTSIPIPITLSKNYWYTFNITYMPAGDPHQPTIALVTLRYEADTKKIHIARNFQHSEIIITPQPVSLNGTRTVSIKMDF